jgi:hypothetical protein
MNPSIDKLQGNARAFVAALFSAPTPGRFPTYRERLAWREEETPPVPVSHQLPPVPSGSPEAMVQLYFTGLDSFYSEDFRAGFEYTARVLLGRPARKRTLPLPSARYDAFQYGCREAQEFAQSDEWKRSCA